MEDFMLNQELGSALLRAAPQLHKSHMLVANRKPLTEAMFAVEFVIDGRIQVSALAVLVRNFFDIYLEAGAAHRLLTMPALESYTVDHPWIAGA